MLTVFGLVFQRTILTPEWRTFGERPEGLGVGMLTSVYGRWASSVAEISIIHNKDRSMLLFMEMLELFRSEMAQKFFENFAVPPNSVARLSTARSILRSVLPWRAASWANCLMATRTRRGTLDLPRSSFGTAGRSGQPTPNRPLVRQVTYYPLNRPMRAWFEFEPVLVQWVKSHRSFQLHIGSVHYQLLAWRSARG